MNKIEILNLIKQGESETIECKSSFNQDTIITLTAFANKKGGKVILGVSDSLKITGVEINKESLQKWTNEIKLKTEPSIIPDIELYLIDTKYVVLISIPEFPIKPVAFRGRFYIRKQNAKHKLALHEINDIYLKSIQTSWDSYPHQNSTYKDLNKDKIQQFVNKVNESGRFKLNGNPKYCLNKLRLLRNNIPTNAAMILFSEEEMYYNVHIGRFKTPSYIIDDKMVRGNLFDVVETTMNYIISHLKVAFEFTGKLQRTEIFEYPLPAIRELLLNAVVHRDYLSPTDIQIKIFDKEITIFNPGKLYGGLTIEDLKTDTYQAQSRNKLLTEAFYLTKDIEKYGSGYRRVREQIAEFPSMYFNFEENSGGYLIKIGYKKQRITSDDTNNVVDDAVDDVVDNRRKEIISLLSKNKYISATKIAKLLNIAARTVQRDIAKFKKQGKIKRIGANKGGYWKIIDKK